MISVGFRPSPARRALLSVRKWVTRPAAMKAAAYAQRRAPCCAIAGSVVKNARTLNVTIAARALDVSTARSSWKMLIRAPRRR